MPCLTDLTSIPSSLPISIMHFLNCGLLPPIGFLLNSNPLYYLKTVLDSFMISLEFYMHLNRSSIDLTFLSLGLKINDKMHDTLKTKKQNMRQILIFSNTVKVTENNELMKSILELLLYDASVGGPSVPEPVSISYFVWQQMSCSISFSKKTIAMALEKLRPET